MSDTGVEFFKEAIRNLHLKNLFYCRLSLQAV